jgi:hypothetical protein
MGERTEMTRMVTKRQIRSFGMALVVAIIAMIVLALAHAATVRAQAANTLKVSPVRTDVQVEPGTVKTVPMTISNLTDENITVRAVANDFVSGDERGTPALILDENEFAQSHSLKRYITPIPNVEIPANESVTINVVITVPATAQAGGYFGAIRFAPTDPDGGGQVNLSASVASLILLTVPGDVLEQLELTDFNVQQNGATGSDFRTSDNLQVSARFKNSGGIQLAPFGKISVKNGDTVVYEADFNNKTPRDMVLPGGARIWDIPLENIGEFGHYEVFATFSYGEDSNQSIDVTKSFWVIPWWVIITALAGLLVLIAIIALIIWLVVRRRRRPTVRGLRSRGGYRRSSIRRR